MCPFLCPLKQKKAPAKISQVLDFTSAEGQNRTADTGIFSPSQAKTGLCCYFKHLNRLIKNFLFLVSFGSVWPFLASMVTI